MGALLLESEQVNYSAIPIYYSNKVEILILIESNALPTIPHKIYINKQQLALLKLVGARDVDSTYRELKAYIKI